MAYIPKSQIKHIKVNKELVYKGTDIPYVGDAIVHSSGKTYAGTNRNNLGKELVPNLKQISNIQLVDEIAPNEKYFSFVKEVRKYNIKKTTISSFLRDRKMLPSSKPAPSEAQYQRTYFRRYFARRINGDQYTEISQKTFKLLKEKQPIYDYNLYEIGSLVWFIAGSDTQRKNALSLKKAQLKHKNILYLFPLLNEYLRPVEKIEENLYTNGGELYYKDGSEYIGAYHIHPVKGPMVGAVHSSSPHDTLYYFSSLPQIPGIPYEEFVENHTSYDCYKCMTINGNQQIVSSKRSLALGCPPNSYTTYEEALEECPKISTIIDNIDKPPMLENNNNNQSAFNSTRPNVSNATVTPTTPENTNTTTNTSPVNTRSNTSGGGTSGGGGGGY